MNAKQKKDAIKTKNGVETVEIEAEAYRISLERQRDGAPEDHLSDWYEAERRLTNAER